MAEFKVGDTVKNINTNQKGKVSVVYPAKRGLQLYSVFYSMDCERDENEADLELDVEIRDLFDRFLQGAFRGYSDFQVYNTTFKIENSSNNMLSSIKASKTMFKTYQYIPLMRFLNSDLKRLLIADEVGLGKTIEAGHIMLELKARGELKNVLVVCPSSLSYKWREELHERFGLTFEIYEDKRMMREDLRGHSGSARGIITYESLSDRIVNKDNSEKSVLRFIEENNIHYSLVICDEAHRVRNSGTNRYNAIDRLLKQTDSVLFLTATPIMLGRENLFFLLNLLNKQRYPWKDAFEEQLKHAEPFVWAINALNNNSSFNEVRQGLEERIPHDDYIRELSRFKQLFERLNGEDTIHQRTLIQNDLYDINPLSSIMTRTRKVDVNTELSQVTTRNTQAKIVDLFPEEQRLFEQYMDSFSDLDPFSRTTRERQVASSVYGFGYTDDSDSVYLKDAKFEKLLEVFHECDQRGSGKMIVFVEFISTLKYLKKRLSIVGIECREISGENKNREERISAIEDFRIKGEVKILISTKAGGEGLDLQFCDTLVNYDLPWNPMEVEQRIGRIDRIGQEAEVINIFSLIVKGSIQEKIHERLLNRIEVFRNTIGDLEPILNAQFDKNKTIEQTIEELYRTELSQEQLEERLDRIEQAIERNMEDSKILEKELQDSFTSDAYLRNHLNAILRNESYVTEKELENYVRSMFRKHLPTCIVSTLNNGFGTISIPRSSPKTLINFMLKFSNLNGEQGEVVSEFINRTLRDKDSIKITFSQEIAEKNRNVTFLNIYHPLVLAAKELFHSENNNCGNVFRFLISPKYLKTNGQDVKSGYYALAIYNVSTEINRYGKTRIVQESFTTVYNIQESDIIENSEIVNSFYRAIQTSGEFWDSEDTFMITKEEINEMRVCMKNAVDQYCKSHEREIRMSQKDDVEQQRQGQNFRYQYQIEQQKLIIQDYEDRITECNNRIMVAEGDQLCIWDSGKDYNKRRTYTEAKLDFERVLPAMRGRLKSIEAEFEAKSHELDVIPDPIVTSKLMMLNLIQVK